MRILLSGYYGYANAGDEAVLAAVLDHLSHEIAGRAGARTFTSSQPTFVVTSGDRALTESWHGAGAAGSKYLLRAIERQAPRELVRELRACDLFVSGGGSLLQDVTSLRSVVYYAGLIRLAALARKPVAVYAHGVGPLVRPIARKLARAAFQKASVLTVRDQGSADLLRKIGVSRAVEVTADPVWGLEIEEKIEPAPDSWTVALRSWVGADRGFNASLARVAREHGARLRLLPMQPEHDEPICRKYLQEHGDAAQDEVLNTRGAPPRAMLALACSGGVMIAMRLHALIFAASCGVPCVAVDYDPKVAALARIIGAPCLPDLNDATRVGDAIEQARPLSEEARRELADKARLNARRAADLVLK